MTVDQLMRDLDLVIEEAGRGLELAREVCSGLPAPVQLADQVARRAVGDGPGRGDHGP